LYVGRLSDEKGVEYLLRAMPSIIQESPKIHLEIVGDGPERKKLEAMVENMNIARNFKFIGEVPREAVLHLLEESDIFVLPSRNEAFGISILEAFSKNIPVVAMNHSGVSDIIAHRKTGLLSEDNLDMANNLKDLINNVDLRESLSIAAYGEIWKYNWRDIASSIEQVYAQVIYEKNFHIS